MLFKDEQVGGRNQTPAFISYSGDQRLAFERIPIAQQKLGELKRAMELSGVTNQFRRYHTDDGTIIECRSLREGLSDTDQIHIDVRSVKPEKSEKETLIIMGYIIKGRCTKDGDTDYLQSLYFPVTVDSITFDPHSGSGAGLGAIVFDNYPDYGAKYVSRGADACDEVFFANYDRTYPLLSTTGPSYLSDSPSFPADPGKPALASGWTWGTYDTWDQHLTGSVPGGNQATGTTYSFNYVQWDGATPGFYWAGYPGGESGWMTDYAAHTRRQQMTLHKNVINARYVELYDEELATFDGSYDEHYYFTVNHFPWLRKHKQDHGFASSLGFYVDTDGALILSERWQTGNNQNVGQGFLFMVNKNQPLRVNQYIIDDNTLHTTSSSGVIPDTNSVGAQWQDPETGDTHPVNLNALPTNGLRAELPMSSNSYFGFYPFVFTPATFEVGDNQDQNVVSDTFHINCDVPNGIHKIDIMRELIDDAYTCKAEIVLFTTLGTRIVNKSVGAFSMFTSQTKIKIPIGIPIEPDEIYQI